MRSLHCAARSLRPCCENFNELFDESMTSCRGNERLLSNNWLETMEPQETSGVCCTNADVKDAFAEE